MAELGISDFIYFAESNSVKEWIFFLPSQIGIPDKSVGIWTEILTVDSSEIADVTAGKWIILPNGDVSVPEFPPCNVWRDPAAIGCRCKEMATL